MPATGFRDPVAGVDSDTLSHPRKVALTDALFSSLSIEGSPGCAVGVVRQGELVFSKGYGYANLDHGVPLDARSSFYLASVSKQFIGAAIGLLALDGSLDLDDEVREFIPELPDYGTPVTIRHLLHHTSGIRDYLTLFTLAGQSFQDFFDNDDAIEIIRRQKALNFEPGSEFLYSNSGYVLLSEIVERITGQTLDAFTQERLFAPLGMSETHWGEDVTRVVPGRAVSYEVRDETPHRFIWNFHAKGDGNLHSTVEDLARWDTMFYRTDEPWASLTELLYTRGVLTNGSEIPYALGLGHGSYEEHRFISHGGGMLGYRTFIQRFPEDRFTTVVLCNLASVNPGRFAQRLADIWLLDREPAPSSEAPPQESPEPDGEAGPGWEPDTGALAEYQGTYYSEELDVTLVAFVEDGVLRVGEARGESMELDPREPDVFTGIRGATFTFRREGGEIPGFTLDAGRVRGLRFDRAEPS